jgi:hypothetical protein
MDKELTIYELRIIMEDLKTSDLAKWYELQMQGLFLILSDGLPIEMYDGTDFENNIVYKSYLFEKMSLINSKQGINFHPEILRAVLRK